MANELDPDDVQALYRLKAKYFRYVDTKRWASLRQLFTDDARFEGFSAQAENPDIFVQKLERNLGVDVVTVHQGFMPELQKSGQNKVRGVWAMHDYLQWTPGEMKYLGVDVSGQWGLRGYGHYEDEYRWEEAQWKISFMRLTRLRLDPLVGEPPTDAQYPFERSNDRWLGEKVQEK